MFGLRNKKNWFIFTAFMWRFLLPYLLFEPAHEILVVIASLNTFKLNGISYQLEWSISILRVDG